MRIRMKQAVRDEAATAQTKHGARSRSNRRDAPAGPSSFPGYIRYCLVIAAPSRLLLSMNSPMNSCMPCWKISSMRLFSRRRADRARLALGGPLAAIGAPDVVEIEHQVL